MQTNCSNDCFYAIFWLSESKMGTLLAVEDEGGKGEETGKAKKKTQS